MIGYGYYDVENNYGAIWGADNGPVTVYISKPTNFFSNQTEHITSLTEFHENEKHESILEYSDFPLVIQAGIDKLLSIGVCPNKSTLKKLSIPVGHYFPRVWRGVDVSNFLLSSHQGKVLKTDQEKIIYMAGINSAESLFDEFERLFLSIEPCHANDATYSHKIRELLILASTEVEASWRGVYTSNFDVPKRCTTSEYYKLKALLKLDMWSVELKNYPEYKVINPFLGWSDIDNKTTESLGWYDDYNSVKHNREDNFNKATLKSLINAMAAVHVLLVAQWGPGIFKRYVGDRYSPFATKDVPYFDSSEHYVNLCKVDPLNGRLRFVDCH